MKTSISISDATKKQLASLKALTGMRMGTIITTAVDRYYREEIRTMRAEDYVHEYQSQRDGMRYVVAEYRDGRYYGHMTAEARRLNGESLHTVFGPLEAIIGNTYHYARRADALRKARELYGVK